MLYRREVTKGPKLKYKKRKNVVWFIISKRFDMFILSKRVDWFIIS